MALTVGVGTVLDAEEVLVLITVKPELVSQS